MSDVRQHYAIATCGRKYTGKSTEINKIALSYTKQKVIIIDPNGSPAYAMHPQVSYEELIRFKSGIVKFYDQDNETMWRFFLQLFNQNEEKGKKFDTIQAKKDGWISKGGEMWFNPDTKQWRNSGKKRPKFNGLLAIEDATKLGLENPPKDIKAFFVDHRMWGADIIVTFHSIESVPRFFWKMLTHIMIKKTQDLVEENISFFRKRVPNFKVWFPIWKKVSESKDEYVCKTVETLL